MKISLYLLAITLFIACGKSADTNLINPLKTNPVLSVKIKSSSTIKIGIDTTLSALVTGGVTKTVKWDVEGVMPTGLSITGNLLKTSVGYIPPQSITLIATSTEDNTKSDKQVFDL